MTLGSVLAEDRRLIILRALLEDHDRRLSERILRLVLVDMGHRVSGDMVRGDVQWLADQRLVRLVALTGGDVTRIVELTEEGVDVGRGHPHPGVAELPSPRSSGAPGI